MPKFYEEAAHLLLLIMGRGLVIPPGVDHYVVLHAIALTLEQMVRERRSSHADAAMSLLDGLAVTGLASIEAAERTRLIALAGTVIGNLMTMTQTRR
jgi:hypothetical protein